MSGYPKCPPLPYTNSILMMLVRTHSHWLYHKMILLEDFFVKQPSIMTKGARNKFKQDNSRKSFMYNTCIDIAIMVS